MIQDDKKFSKMVKPELMSLGLSIKEQETRYKVMYKVIKDYQRKLKSDFSDKMHLRPCTHVRLRNSYNDSTSKAK